MFRFPAGLFFLPFLKYFLFVLSRFLHRCFCSQSLFSFQSVSPKISSMCLNGAIGSFGFSPTALGRLFSAHPSLGRF